MKNNRSQNKDLHCHLFQSKLQMKLFKGTRLWRAVETRLTAAAQEAIPRSMREVEIPEMELRTYKLTFS